MKVFITLFIFCFFYSASFSQDVIVLKKDEQEIKCRIIAVTDTSITYTDWISNSSERSLIPRNEVLSYLIDINSRKKSNQSEDTGVGVNSGLVPITNNRNNKIDAPVNNSTSEQQRLLAPYKSNEVVEGYIVKNNNDTITGYISVVNVAMNQLQVSFIQNKNDSAGIYTTTELKGYGYGNVRYKKIKSPLKGQTTNLITQKNEFLFLHLVVEGPSELYRLFTLKYKSAQLRNSSNLSYYSGKLKTHYLITNTNGASVCTKGRTLKGSLNRIYEDNQTVKDYIYKNGVKEDQLPQIVEMYNNSLSSQ